MQIFYVSDACPSLSQSDVARLVGSAQRRNRQLDLTGALLMSDGRFAQVLEGREVAVTELMAKIESEPRHFNLQVLHRIGIERRLFAGWDMAFVESAAWQGGALRHHAYAGALLQMLLQHVEAEERGLADSQ